MKKNILVILSVAFILAACEKETVQISSSPCIPHENDIKSGYIKGTCTGTMPDSITPYTYGFNMEYENISSPSLLSTINVYEYGVSVRMRRSNICSDNSEINFSLKYPLSSFSFPVILDTLNCNYYNLGIWLIRNIGDSIVHRPIYYWNESDSTFKLTITSYDSISSRMTGTFTSPIIPDGTFDIRFKKILMRKK
jgi:hypothetical protein